MQKRRAVREVAEAGLSNVRRACRYLKLSESSYYYREKEVSPYQVKLRKRIIHLSWEFPRYGYRRIRALLERESWKVSRKPPKRRRQGKSTGLPTMATHPNHVWSWDFVHDRTDDGGKVIIDNWRKLYNAIHPHSNLGYDSPNMFFESRQKTIQTTPAGQEPTPGLPNP